MVLLIRAAQTKKQKNKKTKKQKKQKNIETKKHRNRKHKLWSIAPINTDRAIGPTNPSNPCIPRLKRFKNKRRKTRRRSRSNVPKRLYVPSKTFVEYSEAMFHTLATRAAELISVARRAARWQQTQCASLDECPNASLIGRQLGQERTQHHNKLLQGVYRGQAPISKQSFILVFFVVSKSVCQPSL
jgi:hypothetical protein